MILPSPHVIRNYGFGWLILVGSEIQCRMFANRKGKPSYDAKNVELCQKSDNIFLQTILRVKEFMLGILMYSIFD